MRKESGEVQTPPGDFKESSRRGSSPTIARWTTQIACSASTNSPTTSESPPKRSTPGATDERDHAVSGSEDISATGGPTYNCGSKPDSTSRTFGRFGISLDDRSTNHGTSDNRST